MNRISPLHPTEATGKTKELFDTVQAKLGKVPNLLRTMGHSPATLEGYLNFGGALGTGNLSAKQREQVALTVAEVNICHYCLSAHTFVGGKLGLSNQEINDARHANAADHVTDAVLKFARSVVVSRGEVNDADLHAARSAGLNDGDILETVALVSFNILTNYVNHVAHTTIDFPEVKPGEVEALASA